MEMNTLTAEDLAETAAEAERRTYVDPHGCVVDAETGEVLDHVEAPMRIDSEGAAEWTLELRSRIEGSLAGLQARRAGLVASIDALIAAEHRALSWWEWRFASQLTDFAKANLPAKGKTWRCAWGKVAFRATKGTTAIVDEEAALEFVRLFDPGSVQRKEWVTATICKQVAARLGATFGETVETPFLKSTEAGENVTISTGIDTEARR